MLERRAPVALLVARHSSRNGGFWPDKSASELPVWTEGTLVDLALLDEAALTLPYRARSVCIPSVCVSVPPKGTVLLY